MVATSLCYARPEEFCVKPGGRFPKLTYPQLRMLDAWYAKPGHYKDPPWKVMMRNLGVSRRTLEDAVHRRGGYVECQR